MTRSVRLVVHGRREHIEALWVGRPLKMSLSALELVYSIRLRHFSAGRGQRLARKWVFDRGAFFFCFFSFGQAKENEGIFIKRGACILFFLHIQPLFQLVKEVLNCNFQAAMPIYCFELWFIFTFSNQTVIGSLQSVVSTNSSDNI